MDDVAVVGTIFGTLIPVVMFIGLFTFLAIAARSSSRRRVEEARARYEFLKKMTEGASFDTEKFIEYERAELDFKRKRRIANLRLGGFILLGIGLALMIFMFAMASIAEMPGWTLSTIGLCPAGLGAALLFASKLEAREAAEGGSA